MNWKHFPSHRTWLAAEEGDRIGAFIVGPASDGRYEWKAFVRPPDANKYDRRTGVCDSLDECKGAVAEAIAAMGDAHQWAAMQSIADIGEEIGV